MKTAYKIDRYGNNSFVEKQMKIRVVNESVDELDESKFNKKNLYHHGVKRQHLSEYEYDPRFPDFGTTGLSELLRKYNEIGDILSNSPAGSPSSKDRIVGFVDRDGRTVKYDRKYGDFIVFKGDDTITMFKKTEQQFQNTVKRDYEKDIEN